MMKTKVARNNLTGLKTLFYLLCCGCAIWCVFVARASRRILSGLTGNGAKTTPIPVRRIETMTLLQTTDAYPGKYVSFKNKGPMKTPIKCTTCAYVSGSGHLKNSGRGEEIDSHDCVIRSNDAPTAGHERDVGNKTTLRTVAFRSLKFIRAKLRKKGKIFDPRVLNETLLVGFQKSEGQLDRLYEQMLESWPDMKLFLFTTKYVEEIRQKFESEVGETSKDIWISNGYYSLILARDICGEIDVYGITDPGYCERIRTKDAKAKKVPYYYYWDIGSECTVMLVHDLKNDNAHRFSKEKTIFKDWIREWGNLHFRCPEWPD